MNYYKMTQEQLWGALHNVNKELKKMESISAINWKTANDQLKQERDEIIGIFVEFYGYNPDNLVTSLKLDDVVEKAQENPDIYPYNL